MFSIRRNIYRFCTVVVSLVVLFMNSFSMAYPTGASASNFYYLDNDYESSSVYASVEPTGSRSTSYPSRSYEADEEEEDEERDEEKDGMRGFDPAFEDDTEDNGISRYMENNDDEGWD